MKSSTKSSLVNSRIESMEQLGVNYNKQAIEKAYDSQGSSSTSFVIKAIALLGGLIGSLTFLAAIYFLDLTQSAIFNVILAVLLLVPAVAIHKGSKSFFLDTILICLMLLSSFFSYMSLVELQLDTDLLTGGLFIALGVFSLVVFKNELLSFLASLGVLAGVYMLSVAWDMYLGSTVFYSGLVLFMVSLFLRESWYITRGSVVRYNYKSMRLACVIMLIFVLNYTLASSWNQHYFFNTLIGSIMVILGFAWSIYTIVVQYPMGWGRQAIALVVVSLLFIAPAYMSLGFGLGLLVLVLSFRALYTTGIVLGVAMSLYFLVLFYYELDFTLMQKSLMLMATGGILLVLYALVLKKISDEKV